MTCWQFRSLTIDNTDTAGISGSLVGVTVNSATAIAQNTVKAGIRGAEINAESGTVTIRAEATNDAEADRVRRRGRRPGRRRDEGRNETGTAGEEEVVADIGNDTHHPFGGLKLQSISKDDIFADGQALSGGLIGVAGADVDTVTRQDAIARIGDNVEIHTGTLEIAADHGQSVDSRGDATAFGLGAGTGVDVDNLVLGQAVVEIGQDSKLYASDIFIDAKNVFTKERFKTGFNLTSGSVSLVSFGSMSSTTEIGNGAQSFDARVDIGNGTLLQVDSPEGEKTPVIGAGSRTAPRIEIETYINAKGVDNVKVESVSGLAGGAKGTSVMNAELNSQVNIAGARIINNDGDVFFTTRTDTLLRPNADLIVASGLAGGAFANVSTDTNARNEVNLTNSYVRGSDISLFAGRDSIGVPNIMFSFADAQVFTASLLPSIGIPDVDAHIVENNIVNVLSNTIIEATSDINLYATEGIGGQDRTGVTGSVLSLSLVPYAVDIDGSGSVTSTNQVNIADTAYLEAGINNQAPFYILPISTSSPQPGIDLPSDVNRVDFDLSTTPAPTVSNGQIVQTSGDSGYKFIGTGPYSVSAAEDFSDDSLWEQVATLETGGVLLTDAHKIAFGLVENPEDAPSEWVPLVADLEFEAIKLDKLGFFVDHGTIIEDSGNFYVINPDVLMSNESINLVLQDEDFGDTDRWNQMTITYDLSLTPLPTVSNGQIRSDRRRCCIQVCRRQRLHVGS